MHKIMYTGFSTTYQAFNRSTKHILYRDLKTIFRYFYQRYSIYLVSFYF